MGFRAKKTKKRMQALMGLGCRLMSESFVVETRFEGNRAEFLLVLPCNC